MDTKCDRKWYSECVCPAKFSTRIHGINNRILCVCVCVCSFAIPEKKIYWSGISMLHNNVSAVSPEKREIVFIHIGDSLSNSSHISYSHTFSIIRTLLTLTLASKAHRNILTHKIRIKKIVTVKLTSAYLFSLCCGANIYDINS